MVFLIICPCAVVQLLPIRRLYLEGYHETQAGLQPAAYAAAALNYLRSMPENTENVSATTIAKALGFGDVQMRKDLAEASPSGRSRTGRPREKLIRDIVNYLDFTETTDAVVIGTGKLGQALMDYNGFADYGLQILASFDLAAPVSRYTYGGHPMYTMAKLKSFCLNHYVKLGIITVPGEAAQSVCDTLVACGITAIWNFTPVYLKTPPQVLVQSDDLASSFFLLRYRLRHALAEGVFSADSAPCGKHQGAAQGVTLCFMKITSPWGASVGKDLSI